MKKTNLSAILALALAAAMLMLPSCGGSDNKPAESGAASEVQSAEPSKAYDDACAKLSSGDTEGAYKLLDAIRGYAPADEKLRNFFFAPKIVEEHWDNVDVDLFYTYEYNADGNVTSCRDRDSDVRTFSYDSDGNVIKGGDLVFGNGDDVVHEYEYENGRVVRETFEGYVQTYEYNEKGLVAKSVTVYPDGHTVEVETAYTYYDNGSVRSSVEAGAVECLYDEGGRIVAVNYLIAGTVTSTMPVTYGAYGIAGMKKDYGDYGVLEWKYTYDDKGALIQMETTLSKDGSTSSLRVYTFSDNQLFYSENGNVVSRAKTVTYQDPLNADAGINF